MRCKAHLRPLTALLLILVFGLCPIVARAAEQVTLGSVGQASANLWPALIAIDKGFYAAEDLKVDIVYVQSSAALVQQVTAGSIGVSISTGLADPLRAVGMGAPISIVRIEVQAPPLRSGGQAKHREHQGAQRQSHFARRPKGHNAHLRRAHAGT
jgi:ABC-type nitrate/sulfonate/bicarbonate transport system substrate-binding protein